MVLDHIKSKMESQIKKWRNSTSSGRESQKITPEEISLKASSGISLASIKGTPISISTDEGIQF